VVVVNLDHEIRKRGRTCCSCLPAPSSDRKDLLDLM